MRIYLDSAPLIYVVENVQPYSPLIATRLAQPGVRQVCSDLTRLECRVQPLRDNKPMLLTAFETYFSKIIDLIVPLSRLVMDQATELRAQYGFMTPDAIHLAAAIVNKCDLFLTNDQRLQKCQEIKVESL